MIKKIGLGIAIVAAMVGYADAALTIPYVFSPGTTIQSSQVNADFSTVASEVNAIEDGSIIAAQPLANVLATGNSAGTYNINFNGNYALDMLLGDGSGYRMVSTNASGVVGLNPALTAAQACYVDVNGLVASEAHLAQTRGGTGISSTATFPSSGVVVTEAGAETLTNKTLTTPQIDNFGFTPNTITVSNGNGGLGIELNGTGYFSVGGNSGGNYPTPGNGQFAEVNNFSNGSSEVDFFNTTFSAVDCFRIYHQTGGSAATLLAKFTCAGVFQIPGLNSSGVVHNDSGGNLSTSAVSLTSDVSGTLPISNGGTGSTSFTSGSIPYSTGSVFSQNNSNLFWNNSAPRLQIGTTGTPLDTDTPMLFISTANEGGVNGNNAVQVIGDSGKENLAIVSSNHPRFAGEMCGGTTASPSALPSGNVMADYRGMGYTGGAQTYTQSARMEMVSEANFSGTSAPSYISLWTTPVGSLVWQERMHISSAGAVSINNLTSAGPVQTSASGVLSEGSIALGSQVSGTLPVLNGGTGTTIATGTGNAVLSTSPTLVTPALGTPTALVGTNITGTASGLTAGTVTTNANLTGPITSSGNTTSIASQTGTGSTFVMSTSPTITGTLTTSAQMVSGNITFGSTATQGIVASTTNDNAASGNVGYFLSANPGSAVTPGSSNTFTNVASLSIGSGDWIVEGNLNYSPNGTTATLLAGGISTTSGNLDSTSSGGVFQQVPNGAMYMPTGARRIKLASPATVYLVGYLTYSVLGSAKYGTDSIITATRPR